MHHAAPPECIVIEIGLHLFFFSPDGPLDLWWIKKTPRLMKYDFLKILQFISQISSHRDTHYNNMSGTCLRIFNDL